MYVQEGQVGGGGGGQPQNLESFTPTVRRRCILLAEEDEICMRSLNFRPRYLSPGFSIPPLRTRITPSSYLLSYEPNFRLVLQIYRIRTCNKCRIKKEARPASLSEYFTASYNSIHLDQILHRMLFTFPWNDHNHDDCTTAVTTMILILLFSESFVLIELRAAHCVSRRWRNEKCILRLDKKKAL